MLWSIGSFSSSDIAWYISKLSWSLLLEKKADIDFIKIDVNGIVCSDHILRGVHIQNIPDYDFITIISFMFGNFIVPESNKTRIDFENKYLKKRKIVRIKNIHLQIKPDQYIYIESYNRSRDIGYKFTFEKFKNGKLKSKLSANYIKFDTLSKKWILNDYKIRNFYSVSIIMILCKI